MAKNNRYLIHDVAKQAGVSEKQIRDWNSRGYLGEVEKVDKYGMAFYSYTEANLKRAQRIAALKQEGYSPKNASIIVEEEFNKGTL